MAKKSKKVEKETRRLIEGISDLVKKKGDRYKFKSKSKKAVKMVKKKCPHWIYRKGKEQPTTIVDPKNPNNWKCAICGASFPIKPAKIYKNIDPDTGRKTEVNEYKDAADRMLELVNQIQFWSVKLGGDADDTKMFLRLKTDLPRFIRVSKQIVKHVNKRQAWEKNRENTNSMAQFSAYAGFNYKL